MDITYISRTLNTELIIIDDALAEEEKHKKSRQHGVRKRIVKPKPNYNLNTKRAFRSQNKNR